MPVEALEFMSKLIGGALILGGLIGIINALSPNKPTTKGDWK